MSDNPELIRSAFLRNLQFENECNQTGRPCHDKCGCALEVQEWVDEQRGADLGLEATGPDEDSASVGNSLPSGKSSQPADSTGDRTGGSK